MSTEQPKESINEVKSLPLFGRYELPALNLSIKFSGIDPTTSEALLTFNFNSGTGDFTEKYRPGSPIQKLNLTTKTPLLLGKVINYSELSIDIEWEKNI
jgi:hypothetical protein